jgi:hypothetical protein
MVRALRLLIGSAVCAAVSTAVAVVRSAAVPTQL